MTNLKRNYACKDVEVLTVTAEIIASAQNNLPAIAAKRAAWADPYFPDFLLRVDGAFQNFLGIDNAADLRNKTSVVKLVMAPAKADLSTFKINLEADFNKNKPRLAEIETILGFTPFWKLVQRSNQQSTVELLYRFKQNMTTGLQAEITEEGTDAAVITSIISYADALKNANISQEFAKAQRPLISAAAVTEFNDIYDEIIKVCKICRNLFKNEPILKNSFSFSAVKKRLGSTPERTAPVPTA